MLWLKIIPRFGREYYLHRLKWEHCFRENRVVIPKLETVRVVLQLWKLYNTAYVTTKLTEIVCQSQHANHNEIKSKRKPIKSEWNLNWVNHVTESKFHSFLASENTVQDQHIMTESFQNVNRAVRRPNSNHYINPGHSQN